LYYTNGVDFITITFTLHNIYQPIWNHLESTDGFFLQADLEPYGIKQLTSGYIYDRINVSYQISNSNLYLNYYIRADANISLGTDPIVIRPDYLLTGTGYEYDDSNTFPVIGTGNALNYSGSVPVVDWIGYQLTAVDDGSKNLIFVSTPVSVAGGGPIIFSLTPDNLIKLQIHYSAVIPLRKL
jgi:hypothetical protein